MNNSIDIIEYELRELKLSGMASCWTSMKEAGSINSTSFRDGLSLLLQSEKDYRLSNKTRRLIKNAGFRYQSSIPEVICDSARGFDKELINRLSTCEYIKNGLPVIITGPTGTGKSHLSTALGHQACLLGYKVLYYNFFRLLENFDMAQIEGSTLKFYDKLASTDLLILDDCFTRSMEMKHVSSLMQIIEERHGRKSTIFASQIPVANWYEMLSMNSNYAEAILDRIVPSAMRFTLQGSSFRKK